MTVAAELERRIEDAQEKLSIALAELSTFSSFKTTLDVTGVSLEHAASTISELAQKVEAHAGYLARAATALSDVVDVLKQADFAEIRKDLASLQLDSRNGRKTLLTQLSQMNEVLTSGIERTGSNVTSQISAHTSRLSEVLGSTVERSAGNVIHKVTLGISGKVDLGSQTATRQAYVTWSLLVVCISIVAYIALRHS